MPEEGKELTVLIFNEGRECSGSSIRFAEKFDVRDCIVSHVVSRDLFLDFLGLAMELPMIIILTTILMTRKLILVIYLIII